MEQLTWTGSLAFLNPFLLSAISVLVIAIAAQILLSFVPHPGDRVRFLAFGLLLSVSRPGKKHRRENVLLLD